MNSKGQSEPIQPQSGVPIDVDLAADQFEDAWESGEAPRIDRFLPPGGQNRDDVLIELVHIDLERRIKRGESVRVEMYLEQHPELARHPAVVLDLIANEYELRSREDPHVSIQEYSRRFPAYADRLAARLRELPATLPRTFRINCPDCGTAIAVSESGSQESFTCSSCGSVVAIDRNSATSWASDRLPTLGKFQLLEAVGRGNFGTVYRARDKELDRIVAVKVPRSGQLATRQDEDRLVREARSVAQLRHPGIVPVYEVGRTDTFPYIVCEFVHGITLADALTGRRFGFRDSASLAAHIAEALEHAHGHGVIHRDLKPSNVLLDPGVPGTAAAAHGRSTTHRQLEPRLTDFGLARRDEGEITVTMEGVPLGTPAYMSPEQAAGEAHQVDCRTDVYSLGVVLYELLTGELPFRGNSRMLLHQVLNEEPRAPRHLNDQIPRDLETITLKAMAKERERRYASAGDLAADLNRWLAGEPILARPIGRIGRLTRWCRRKPAHASLAAAVSLLIIACASALAVWWQADLRRDRDRDRHLLTVRSAVDANDGQAGIEAAAGRFDVAERLLDQALDQSADEPQLAELRGRIEQKHDRIRRIAQFYSLADDAERLEFVEYDDEATVACEEALNRLNVLDQPDWWNRLPGDDLPQERLERLREDVYRQLLLLAALRAKRGLMNFASRSAADAYRSALSAIELAHAYRPSHAGLFAQSFCRIGLGESEQVKPLPKLSPTSATDYYFLGILHFWFANFPNDPISQFALGPIKKLGGLDFDTPAATGEWMLRACARLEPHHYWNHFWLGWSLDAAGDSKGAELAYNTCVAIRPHYALGYSERAGSLITQLNAAESEELKKELRSRAIQDLDQSVRLSPQDPRIHIQVAMALAQLGERDRAIAAAIRGVGLEGPPSRWAGKRAYAGKHMFYSMAKRYAELVTGEQPDHLNAWVLKSMTHLALDEDDDALSAAERSLALRNNAPSLAVRGMVRLKRQEVAAALADFQAALREDSNHFAAAMGIALAAEAQAKGDEALAAFDTAAKLAVTNWQQAITLAGRARILTRQNRHEDAQRAAEQAKRLDPIVKLP